MTTITHAPPAQRPANPRDVLTRAAAGPDVTGRYGTHADALIDLYLPPGQVRRAPLVVLFHGGFWRAQYDRVHLRPLAVALRECGFAVALPEYRRIGGAPGLEGGYPATFDDATQALHAVPTLLAEHGMTASHTTLAGHSAGGHLVLWLAGIPSIGIDRVVALAPVADLYAAYADHLGDDAVRDLLGGSPESAAQRYAATDVAARLAQRPPGEIVVLHGSEDDRVPISNVRGLLVRHPWITLHELQGTEHFALIDPLLHAWPVVRAAMDARRDGGHT